MARWCIWVWILSVSPGSSSNSGSNAFAAAAPTCDHVVGGVKYDLAALRGVVFTGPDTTWSVMRAYQLTRELMVLT